MSSSSLMVPVPAKGLKKLFVYESRKAAEDFLQKNKLITDSTPILIPFKTDKNVIKFLKPSDGEGAGCIRIMGARNELRDKKRKEKFVDWFNRELLGRDFAPHLNDLEGDDVLLEENGLIVIYQRVKQEGGRKNIGAAFAAFFRAQKDNLIEQIKEAKSNDEVELNIGSFTQGLTLLGLEIEVAAGMTYFIKDGEAFRHTFRAGVSDPIVDYLYAEAAETQEVRINYNKTEHNHILPFLKDWTKGTIFAAITAVGAGVIASIFLIAVIAALIAVVTFIALSVIAFYKASKDNQKTIEFGNPELEIIKPEAVKQENSIFNQLKSNLLMVVAYLRGKSSADKQTVNLGSQPVQPEIAALESPVTEQAKVIQVEQNSIPIPMSSIHTAEKRSSIPIGKVSPVLRAEQNSTSISMSQERSPLNEPQNRRQAATKQFLKGSKKAVKFAFSFFFDYMPKNITEGAAANPETSAAIGRWMMTSGS